MQAYNRSLSILKTAILIFALTQAIFAVEINSSPTDQLDDTEAIKQAIQTAKNGTDKIINLQQGLPGYIISEPILIDSPDIQFVGPLYTRATIYPSFGSGPAILAASPRRQLELTDSLMPGAGRAMRLTPYNYLYLSDAPTMGLNGLSSFTAECFASSSDPEITEPNVLFSSQGIRLSSEGLKSAFRVMVAYGNTVRASFTDTTGYHELMSAAYAWTPGTHHVAFQYQSGNARIFLDGQVVASYTLPKPIRRPGRGAITATIVQKASEEVMVGGGMGGFPYGGYFFGASELDAIDSVRFSSTAKYQAAFTAPTQKLSREADTLMLLNFDHVTDYFVVGETNLPPNQAWLTLPLPVYDQQSPFGQIGNIGIRNLLILGNYGASGVYGLGTIYSDYQNISTVNAMQGMYLSDVYFSHLQDLNLPAQRMSLVISGQGEALTVDRVSLPYAKIPLVLSGAVGGYFSNIFLTPSASSTASALIKGGDVFINSINVDDEGQTNGGGDASIIAGDMTSLTLLGGQILNYSKHPVLMVDGLGQGRVSINNTTFFSGPAVPYLIHVTNPRPDLVVGHLLNWNNRPLTNEPGAVSVVY